MTDTTRRQVAPVPDSADTARSRAIPVWVWWAGISLLLAGLDYLYAQTARTFVPAAVPVERYFSKRAFVGVVPTALALGWLFAGGGWLWHRAGGSRAALERVVPMLSAVGIAALIAWCGLVLWADPYVWMFTQGDAAFNVHALQRMLSGEGPGQTMYYAANPYTKANLYYYASIFSVGFYWLPLLLITPLYALSPAPPMHIYAVVIVVFAMGTAGIYAATRALGGSRALAALAAVGYAVLPQVEVPLFFKGYFDLITLAILPWVFAALFSQRWPWFLVLCALFALINLPEGYTIITIGVALALVWRKWWQAAAAVAIGWLVPAIDWQIFMQTLCGLSEVQAAPPSFVTQYVLGAAWQEVGTALLFWFGFVMVLLLTTAGLPLAVRRRGQWDLPVILLWLVALGGVALSLFRSYGWATQRTALIVVPVYLAAIASYIHSCDGDDEIAARRRWYPSGSALAATVCAMTLWTTWYYPWVGLADDKLGKSGRSLLVSPQWKATAEALLGRIYAVVPAEASVAFGVDAELEAYMVNRYHNIWRLGSEPSGVDYYVVQHSSAVPWAEKVELLGSKPELTRVYNDNTMDIFRNSRSALPPRPPHVLEWDVVWRGLTFQQCPAALVGSR